MTRLRRIESRERIFFVTTNLARGAAQLGIGERDLLLGQLGRQRAAGGFLLFGYMVMPDHLHLLIAPVAADLIGVMREFKSCRGQEIRVLRQSPRPIWQARYFDFILRRVGDFWEKLDYIHENPVEAGLVRHAEDWPWSSAAHYAGGSGLIPVDAIELPGERAAWLYPAPWRRA